MVASTWLIVHIADAPLLAVIPRNELAVVLLNVPETCILLLAATFANPVDAKL